MKNNEKSNELCNTYNNDGRGVVTRRLLRGEIHGRNLATTGGSIARRNLATMVLSIIHYRRKQYATTIWGLR